MRKSHVSIKWYRPAWRLLTAPHSKSDSKKLLTSGPGVLQDVRKISKTKIETTFCKVQPNIFRSEWDLWTDPKTTTYMKRLCGWEERSSLWIGILPNSNSRIGQLEITTLLWIFRFDQESQVQSSQISQDKRNKPLLPKRWLGGKLQLRNGGRGGLWGHLTASMSDADLKKTEAPPSVKPVIEQKVPRIFLESTFEEAIFSRPIMDRIGEQLKTTSTASCFRDIFGSNSEATGSDSYFGILMPLFEEIQQDVTEFLTQLHQVLDTINSEVLDDIKIENQLPIWRQLITRAQSELPELQRSLTRFFCFYQTKRRNFGAVYLSQPLD